MLQVSTNPFSCTTVNEIVNSYVNGPKGLLRFPEKEKGEMTKQQIENRSIEKQSGNGEPTNPVEKHDRPAQRRFRDIDSVPLFVSTPTNEGIDTTDKSNAEYLQKKARRISRIYQDHAADPFEALEVEPLLLEYLVRHGAISPEASDLILSAEKSNQKFLLLSELGLPASNANPQPETPTSTSLTTGFALLLNALRYAGHHSLASLLDCGRRIRPSPGLESNDVFQNGSSPQNQRRRGQLSLQIRLDAIKVDPAVYNQALLPHLSASDDRPGDANGNSFQFRSTPVTRLKPFNPMLPSFVEELALEPVSPKSKHVNSSWQTPKSPFWINQNHSVHSGICAVKEPEPTANIDGAVEKNASEKSVGCFNKLFCLFHPLKKRKAKKRRHPSVVKSQSTPAQPCAYDENDAGLTRTRHPIVPTNGAGDGPLCVTPVDHVSAAKLALLDAKSVEFCQAVLNPSFAMYDAIVKYFEQSSGVLVLNCTISPPIHGSIENQPRSANPGTALCITVVATRSDLVKRLAESCEPNSNPSPELPRVSKSIPSEGSKLSTDLQKVLKGADILSVLNLQDFRLSVSLDSSEVAKALEELIDLVE